MMFRFKKWGNFAHLHSHINISVNIARTPMKCVSKQKDFYKESIFTRQNN